MSLMRRQRRLELLARDRRGLDQQDLVVRGLSRVGAAEAPRVEFTRHALQRTFPGPRRPNPAPRKLYLRPLAAPAARARTRTRVLPRSTASQPGALARRNASANGFDQARGQFDSAKKTGRLLGAPPGS